MSNSISKNKSFEFALLTIRLYKRLVENNEYVISKQLLRSGTSIGANVEEALAASSRKDFQNKMTIASKEARETRYWLSLLKESQLTSCEVTRELAMNDELIKILTSIVKTTKETHDQ